MKKLFFAVASIALLFACKPGSGNGAQDPSSDKPQEEEPVDSAWIDLATPQKRVAVIEEYTGINCSYCPDGHRIVNEIVRRYSGKVFAVNIHAGNYANGTYTTTEGNSYLNEAGVKGYPAGVVNRHKFASLTQKGGDAMSRGDFETAVKKILDMTSPVNIEATAEIDRQTRQLTVKVRGYYTADALDASEQPVSSNSLYVMLLQDSVMGQQIGASYNPEQIVDGRYCHMHMLRTTIDGVWGEEISPVTKRSNFTKEYSYTIPETIGKDNVEAVLEHLNVLVFVAAGHKEIYTATSPVIKFK